LRSQRQTSARRSYAFATFATGETAEVQGRDGAWLRCAILGVDARSRYHIRVESRTDAEALPAVPSHMLRKRLGPGERDFLVDNSMLNHSGLGVKCRREKRLAAVGVEYAPWGTLVSGTDEGDGWVRLGLLSSKYLPTTIHGVQVVVPAGRERPQPEAAPGRRPFVPGEHVSFRGGTGEWYPATVVSRDELRGTYRVDVTSGERSVFAVQDVSPLMLRKPQTTPAPWRNKQQPGLCTGGGCITLTVKTPLGRDMVLEVSRRMKVSFIMNMVCRRMKIALEDCQARTRVTHRAEELSPDAQLETTDLTEGSLVTVEELAP